MGKEYTRTLNNTSYNGFDIIVCNPPYLSQKANQNRITKESVTALVAGISGYEAYDDICKSIQSSYLQSITNKIAIANKKYNKSSTSSSSPSSSFNQSSSSSNTSSSSASISILKQRDGYLLFQLSAAAKAEAIVTSILKKNNFEVISCMKDHRGIPRCIISKMR